MDANAINHSKQKKKSASRTGAAYPRVSREPTGGRFPVPHRPLSRLRLFGADDRRVCRNCSLATPPAVGWIMMLVLLLEVIDSTPALSRQPHYLNKLLYIVAIEP
jgi:hypothetical protein